jgi:hypothetical protein
VVHVAVAAWIVVHVAVAAWVVVTTVTSVDLKDVEAVMVEVEAGAVDVTEMVDVDTPRQEHAEELLGMES